MNYYFIETEQMIVITSIVIAVSFFSLLLLLIKKNIKETPHELLKRKFILGEIDGDEYEQRKRQLQRDEDLKIKLFFLSRM